MEMERSIMGLLCSQNIIYTQHKNWFQEFMTGMEKNLVEPEGKKMLKVNTSTNTNMMFKFKIETCSQYVQALNYVH